MWYKKCTDCAGEGLRPAQKYLHTWQRYLIQQ